MRSKSAHMLRVWSNARHSHNSPVNILGTWLGSLTTAGKEPASNECYIRIKQKLAFNMSECDYVTQCLNGWEFQACSKEANDFVVCGGPFISWLIFAIPFCEGSDVRAELKGQRPNSTTQ